MLTTIKDEAGWKTDGDSAFVYAYNSEGPNRIPMYRKYNSKTYEHITTSDIKEADGHYTADFGGKPMFYALKP
jgi:hypothetical protein